MKIRKIDSKTFDDFCLNYKRFSQYQYSEFSIAANQYNFFCGIYEDETLIGVFRGWKRLVSFVKKIPFIGDYEFIIRRSLVVNYQELDNINFTNAIKKFMKEEKIYLFSISPAEPSNLKEENILGDFQWDKFFISTGWDNKIENDFNKSRVACFEQAVNLDFESMQLVEKTFKKDTMRKVRKAKKVGVTVEKILPDDLHLYFDLFNQTGNRDDFSIKSMDFYYNLGFAFKERAKIYISKINLDVYKEYILQNQPDKVDLIKSIDELKCQEMTLGLAICIDSDYQTYYHSGATSNLFRETMHNYLLHYQAILDSFDQGLLFYNFGAINGSKNQNEPNFSLYQFKSRFASKTLEMYGEFVLYDNTLSSLLNKLK